MLTHELHSGAGVFRKVADLAFGPGVSSAHTIDTFRPERAELDAAVAEVAMRADHPQDVNRLIAAAIRLREAHAVLAEVTR